MILCFNNKITHFFQKATENCVCILHNLSYRFDCGMSNMDVPEVKESRQSLAVQNNNPGCFIINTPKNIEEVSITMLKQAKMYIK